MGLFALDVPLNQYNVWMGGVLGGAKEKHNN